MTPTPHGQVPEALRIADEFRECLEWYTIPSIIDIEDAADELRRLHAENEAIRAIHVQNPAEIEHVADDVSKNGPESNMTQQPAPSAAADPMDWPLPCDVTVGHGTMCKGVSLRTLVMRMKVLYEMATGNNADEVANRTPEENTALADAFRARIAAAPQHPPAPQADSQPAPHSEPWYGHQFKEVRRGYWQCSCGKAIAEAVPSASKDSYPPLPNRYAYDDDGEEMFTADQMRAYVDADRAARAPADSVQEDAARLDWLALAGPTSICLVIDRPHDGEVEVATDDVTGYGKTLREAIDDAKMRKKSQERSRSSSSWDDDGWRLP